MGATISAHCQNNDLKRLPMQRSVHDVIKEASALNALQLEHVRFEELRNRISRFMNGYAVKNVRLPPHALVYRGIRCPNLPLHVSELQHPPESMVQDFGRANRPGKPVFYSTTDWSTVFWELRANKGELLVVSTWITKKELRLMLVGYIPMVLDQLGTARRFDVSAAPSSLDTAANQAIHEFLASEFTKTIPQTENHRYKMSAAIASLFLEERFGGKKSTLIDGLMYPTVARNGRADNIAFMPETLREGLELASVQLLGINEVQHPDHYGLSTLDESVSISPDGLIKWKHFGKKAADVGEEFVFSLEPGKWVMRNKKGEVVETLVFDANNTQPQFTNSPL